MPTSDGNLALAQGARYKRSGMQFFGDSYTPTTMVDSLDTLDFASIGGHTFIAPTIFVPIPELDATKGFVADIANFLSQQFWTFIYAEVVAQPGETVNGVAYPQGFNLDGEGKPILSLQKLHFVYDPLAVLFTPNDLTHKYSLKPKQQVLALTNGQIQEGICWRTDHLQAGRTAPHNISAQQKCPMAGIWTGPTSSIRRTIAPSRFRRDNRSRGFRSTASSPSPGRSTTSRSRGSPRRCPTTRPAAN